MTVYSVSLFFFNYSHANEDILVYWLVTVEGKVGNAILTEVKEEFSSCHCHSSLDPWQR
jgi:hypothetical protein